MKRIRYAVAILLGLVVLLLSQFFAEEFTYFLFQDVEYHPIATAFVYICGTAISIYYVCRYMLKVSVKDIGIQWNRNNLFWWGSSAILALLVMLFWVLFMDGKWHVTDISFSGVVAACTRSVFETDVIYDMGIVLVLQGLILYCLCNVCSRMMGTFILITGYTVFRIWQLTESGCTLAEYIQYSVSAIIIQLLLCSVVYETKSVWSAVGMAAVFSLFENNQLICIREENTLYDSAQNICSFLMSDTNEWITGIQFWEYSSLTTSVLFTAGAAMLLILAYYRIKKNG